MGDEDRWNKVREIVRDECERIEARILEALEKHTTKVRLGFANGKWTGITQEQIAAWKEAYGSCDVEAELKKASAWIVSNPSQAPKSNFSRFLNAWLSRQQNVLSIRAIPTRNEIVTKSCSYCPATSMGNINGWRYCSDQSHYQAAMNNERPARSA
jgi:hypothetical protein